MSLQDLRVLIPCPDEATQSDSADTTMTCRVVSINQAGTFPENLPPNVRLTEPKVMKIKLIKCAPKDQGPLGRITRNQDLDLIASKFVNRCLCGVRNGLSSECRRVACQSNPACHMKPFPRCWPKYQPIKTETREIEVPVQLCYMDDD